MGDFIGGKVGVVVNDGQVFRRLMEELSCRFREEKEVVIKVCSSHPSKLEYQGSAGKERNANE